jgi:hypothetical protein
MMPLVGLLGAGIAIYTAIAFLVHVLRPVGLSPQRARRDRYRSLAVALHPVAEAITCVQDPNEQDWTWQRYTVAALLLALVCLLVLALLALGLSVRTML